MDDDVQAVVAEQVAYYRARARDYDHSDKERAGERFVPDQPTPAVWRRLRDGSEYRVVKAYYRPRELAARLAELGWSAEVRETSTPLLVGTARRISDPGRYA
jgi:hypothetical protein